jgi:dihydrofolate reductase
MSKLVVRSFAISLDGFSAGVQQRPEEPWGKGGIQLMNWAFATKYFSTIFSRSGGEEGIDNDFASQADNNIGATIMGRHMFGPDRGAWDLSWNGWWGDNPPFHHPVFVLCHQKRDPFELKGGTSFTFITDGIESALKQALAVAKGKDVRIGGGPDTVRQYLKARLIDEMHLVQVPLLLGQGERIFEGLGGIENYYECKNFTPSKQVSHLLITRKS